MKLINWYSVLFLFFAPQLFAQELSLARQLASSDNFAFMPPPPSLHEDCVMAQPIFSGCPVTVGSVSNPGTNDNQPSCFGSPEHQSHWFTFTFQNPGSFELMITSLGMQADIDFALWEGACPQASGILLACNWEGPITGANFLPTGISSDPMGTFGVSPNNEIEPTVFVQPGVPYLLLVDNITSNAVGFELEFGGDAIIGGGGIFSNGSAGLTCSDAELYECICGEMGIYGQNPNSNAIDVPPLFCSSIENNIWYALEMCYCFVDLSIEVGDCAIGNGLQAQLFASCGPDFIPKSECINEIPPNSTAHFNGFSCTPGDVYYLMIDGYQADQCDFVIRQTQLAGAPPIILQDTIFGHTLVCEGDTILYEAPPVVGAAHCTFEFSDTSTQIIDPTHNSVTLVFGDESGELCFIASNCEGADTVCMFIQVGTVTYTQTDTIYGCPSGLPFLFDDIVIDDYGIYNYDTLFGATGCDSFLQVVVLELGDVEVEIVQTGDLSSDPTVLLENDSFEIGTTNVYFWEGPGIELASANDFTQNIALPGIYTLTVTDPVSGCSAQDQAIVLPGVPCSPSDSPIAPSDNCSNAPPFCDGYLQGYCSVNAFNTPNDPGSLSCSIENNQWISFTACADTVKLFIEVTNCLEATGLEFSIFEDCNEPVSISDCESILDGDTLAIIAPSNSGEVYQLMIDGINGDICQWRIISTEGISNGGLFQEDNTPGQVTGPTPICLDEPFTGVYTFTPAICNLIDLGGCPGATQQVCIPGNPPPVPCEIDTLWTVTTSTGEQISTFAGGDSTGASITLEISDTIYIPPGEFISMFISVNPFHVSNPYPSGPGGSPCGQSCFTGCATIIPDEPCTVKPLEVILCKPDIIHEYFVICQGDCVEFMGEIFCSPGTFEITENDVCGCEDKYIIHIDEEPLQNPPFVGGLSTFCEPDGLTYTVSFDIVNTGLFDVFVNGAFFIGGTYTESGIPSGTEVDYDLLYVDWICGFEYQETITAFEDCPCVSQTFEEGLITLCPSDCYDLAGNVYCDPGHYEEEIFNPMTGCDDLYIFDIENVQENALATGSVSELCNALNTEYTVTFSITSGVEPYFVNGDPITGNLYQSDPIPSGDSYAFLVTDSGFCDNDQFNLEGTYTCACLTDPGTVEASLLSTCEDEMVSAAWNNDATLDGDDLLVFVLHTGSGTSLGDVLGTNVTGTFGFEPGSMDYGVTYYISPVAGNDAGGTVDMGDACLGVGAGQPVVFYENPEVDILPTSEITCDQNSAPLDAFPLAGSGQYEFTWSGPGLNTSGQSATATQAGTFTCVMTDLLSGCTTETSVTVTGDSDVPEFDLIPSGTLLNCDIQNVLLETSTPQSDLVFTWQLPSGGGASGPSISANEPGGYTVVATAPNGCESEIQINITQDILPPENLTATEGEITCDEPVASLEVNSTTSNVEYTWVFPTGNEVMGDNVTTDIDGQYTIIATGPNGCVSEVTTNVFDQTDPPQNVVATEGVLTCDEPSSTLMASSSTPGVVFTWIFPTGDIMSGDEITTNVSGGYTIIATAPNGCTEEISSNVLDQTDPPQDVTATDGELTCLQNTATLEASSSTPNVTFTWVFPSGDEMVGASISTNLEGAYTLIATTPDGCSTEVTTEVIDNSEAPTLTVTDGEVNCAYPEAVLTAETDMSGVVFTWTFPDGSNEEGGQVSSSQSGVYEIVAQAPNGCETEATTEVIAIPDPILEAEAAIQSPTCFGDSDGSIIFGLTAGGTEPYVLTLDGEPVSGDQFENLAAGNYLLEITDANGCVSEEMLTVPEQPLVTVDLGEDEYANLGDQVILDFETDITPATISWFGPNGETWSGVSSLTVPASANGIYEVEIADENGCSASDAIQVFVEGQGEVFVPNVFSPNGDQVNDILTVFSGTDVVRVNSFSIFDRWGDLIFHDEDFAPHTSDDPPARGWDGTYAGKPLDPAVFVFMAEVEFLTGETKMISGDVTLVK